MIRNQDDPSPKRRAAPLTAWGLTALLALLTLGLGAAAAEAGEAPPRHPNVVLIVVDTLRFDRLSCYGYPRPTTPHVDALLAAGAQFTQARVSEPLTAPSMVSLFTSLHPHEHGTTRNGLPMRPQLPTLSGILASRGYRTAAFVGNWTLRDEISGLGDHFVDYFEVFTRKRWLGLFKNEATAADLTADALEWIEDHLDAPRPRPYMVWIHYVEPHAPYRLHKELTSDLGIPSEGEVSRSDRYDTEVAFVDRAIGGLLAELRELQAAADTLILFVSDHGESLGEHGYWGHGRHLYEMTLRVPMGVVWEGRIPPVTIDALASNLDLAPTLLGLVGLPIPDAFRGHDWSGLMLGGEAEIPQSRITLHQAHKGAAVGRARDARRKGLLEVGLVGAMHKEILRVKGGNLRTFDLANDPVEIRSRVALKSEPSTELRRWLEQVEDGLIAADNLPPPSLGEEDLEQLRALGYID